MRGMARGRHTRPACDGMDVPTLVDCSSGGSQSDSVSPDEDWDGGSDSVHDEDGPGEVEEATPSEAVRSAQNLAAAVERKRAADEADTRKTQRAEIAAAQESRRKARESDQAAEMEVKQVELRVLLTKLGALELQIHEARPYLHAAMESTESKVVSKRIEEAEDLRDGIDLALTESSSSEHAPELAAQLDEMRRMDAEVLELADGLRRRLDIVLVEESRVKKAAKQV